MPKICLVDGSGFIFRAFHAISHLYTKEGLPVNAVYGFTKSILALKESSDTDYIVVVFDASRKTFRNDIYPEYKSHRPPTPEELIPQFSLVREAVTALNIVAVEKEGFEADDIIATYTEIASKQGFEVEIISSDKDLMQLVDDSKNIYMFDALKKKKITEQEVIEKFGVKPNLVTNAQALIGDSSDNVPGIKGIGPKTAANLLHEFGSLQGIITHAESIKNSNTKNKILTYKNDALISLELVTLKKDVPLTIPLEDLICNPLNPKEIYAFSNKLSFTSITAKILTKYNLDITELNTNNDSKNHTASLLFPRNHITTKEILSLTDLTSCLNEIQEAREIFIFHAISGDKSKIKLSLFSALNNTQYEIQTIETPQNDFFQEDNPSFSLLVVLSTLKPILIDLSIKKIFYSLKPFLHLLDNYNVTINAFEDIMLMAYLTLGIKEEEGIETIASKLIGETLEFDGIVIANLFKLLKDKLIESKSYYLYETFDKPLIQILFTMEKNGIKIDKQLLNNLSQTFTSELETIATNIFTISQKEFNIASPKQMGEILFEKMGLEGKKNKNGQWKTDISVLEELSQKGEKIADLLIKWRQLAKLKNTYADSLPEKINPLTGKIHTSYLQCTTSTARLSSIEPNLQNIPIKTKEGKEIRKAFIAENGEKLISLDYSQIELKILAIIANVAKLKDAFQNNKDIHKETASEIFNIPVTEVTPEARRKAKIINFGIIYGQTTHGLAQTLNISREEAKEYIGQYFSKYPEIKIYMDETINFAQKYGFVNTLYNRKCFISYINSKNHHLKQFAQRAAINARIQGTASDIMRKSLIDVDKIINKNNLQAKVLLQIHDEFLITAKADNAHLIAEQIKTAMEIYLENSIKLTVEYNISNNWLDSHN